MDTLLALINAASCGLIALALLGVILSNRVHDGIVIKVGLICISLGFGSIALRFWSYETHATMIGLARSLVLVNGGIAVVILGYLLRRVMAKKRHFRRAEDWTVSTQ